MIIASYERRRASGDDAFRLPGQDPDRVDALNPLRLFSACGIAGTDQRRADASAPSLRRRRTCGRRSGTSIYRLPTM